MFDIIYSVFWISVITFIVAVVIKSKKSKKNNH